jgi:ATP-dependent protease ClpP protease subunit
MAGCATAAPVSPAGFSASAARVLNLHSAIAVPAALDFAEQLQDVIDHPVPSIVVDIDSPGGSLAVGFALIDMLRTARGHGTSITCRVGPGAMAASMAAAIFESEGCEIRVMARGAQLLFHEPSVQDVSGKEHDLRRIADQLADANRRIGSLIAARMHMTADEYCRWIRGHDRWIDYSEALNHHAVDVIEP